MTRASEPGWELAAMNDPTGRRGIWVRETRDPLVPGRVLALEICAGREGDDVYLGLRPGEVIDPQTFGELVAAFDLGTWCVREHYTPPDE